MRILLEVVLPILVIFTMVVVGIDLRTSDFRRVRQYPMLVPGIVICQWTAVMLAAGLVGRFLQLPHAVAASALLFAAAPVATLSSYYTQFARGHLALAVTISAVSNVAAALATPLVAAAGFRLFLDKDAAFDLPLTTVAQQAVVGLLLPLCFGMYIRRRAERWSLRWRPVLQGVAMIAIVAVLGYVAVNQFAVLQDQFRTFFAASVALTLAMLAIGALVACLATTFGEDRRAVLWGFPARNVAVAALLATSVAGQAAMASFIAVLFATQVALLIPLSLWLRRSGHT